MKEISLLEEADLPENFQYPKEMLRLVSSGIREIKPWLILDGAEAIRLLNHLKDRFTDRHLVPFAYRTDTDEVACWEAGNMPFVFVVDPSEIPNWEARGSYTGFYEWLKSAINDFVEFDN